MIPAPAFSSPKIILITGPTRSGKSEWAEQLAIASKLPVSYIATAQVNLTDPEWQTRIEQHRRRRPHAWTTLQVPTALAHTIRTAPPDHCLLVDALGTWLSNLLDQNTNTWETTVQELITSLHQAQSLVILVAEETGWGVVPAYPLGRKFRDRLGILTRKIGAIADPVYLVTAGYVLNLCQLGSPLD